MRVNGNDTTIGRLPEGHLVGDGVGLRGLQLADNIVLLLSSLSLKAIWVDGEEIKLLIRFILTREKKLEKILLSVGGEFGS